MAVDGDGCAVSPVSCDVEERKQGKQQRRAGSKEEQKLYMAILAS